MAIEREIISFDIDATQASRQIDALIANLEQLQQQEKALAKAGKDVSAVQTQIAATTQKLNKALGENVKTQKGLQAQADAANKSLRALNNTQNNLEASTEKAAKSQGRLASSLARNAGKITNIGGALGLAAGGLATFTGAAELGGIALGLLTNITNKAFTALDNYLFPVNEATRLSQELAGSYIAEAADLSALSGIIQDTTTKTDDRARAIDALNTKYKDYLPALLTEKSTNEEVAAAIQKANEALIDKIVATAKAAEAAKQLEIITKEQIRLSNLATDADLNRNKSLAQFGTDLLAFGLGGPLGVFLAETETASEAITGSVEAVTRASIQSNIDAAKTNLDNLNATFDDVKETLKGVKLESLAAASSVSKDGLKQAEQAEKNAKKASDAQKRGNENAAGSLAELEDRLSKVNKELQSQTALSDKAKLAKLGNEYKALSKQVQDARAALEQFKGEQENVNVISRQNDLGTIDRLSATRELQQQELELKRIIADIDAESSLSEERKEALTLSRIRNEVFLLDTQRQLAQQNGQDVSLLEQQLAITIRKRDELAQTIPLQDQLTNQQNVLTRLEIEQLQAQTDPQRKSIELEILDTKLEILDTEIAIATAQGKNTLELEKQVAQLKAQKSEIDGQDVEKQGERFKQRVQQTLDGVSQLSSQAFEAFKASASNQLQQLDANISKTQSRLDELTSTSENVSAEQIRIEQERLDKLNAQREQAAAREAVIIKGQIAAESALTIAKAAAEGGGLASAFTIASAVAALIIGFSQASSVAENAFFEGTTYVKRGKNPVGRDTIPARLNEGEAVIPTATNAKYKKAVQAIYDQSVPADVINNFAANWKSWQEKGNIQAVMNLLMPSQAQQPQKAVRRKDKSERILQTIADNTAQRVEVKITRKGIVQMVSNQSTVQQKLQKRNR